MTTVVVLGVHRSGTSMLSLILQKLGVRMGARQLKGNESGEYGEDLDFLDLNKRILAAAGGSWDVPPARKAILDTAGEFREEIAALVWERNGEFPIWGWKDPRTMLTAPLFHPHLEDPYYVCIFRPAKEIVASLRRRNGDGYWSELVRYYREHLAAFQRVESPRSLRRVEYHDFTANQMAAWTEISKLAAWLKLDPITISAAVEVVRWRETISAQ